MLRKSFLVRQLPRGRGRGGGGGGGRKFAAVDPSGPMASVTSMPSPVGSGGMKFTPAAISTLSELQEDGTPISQGRLGSETMAPNTLGDDESLLSPTVVDTAAPPLLKREDTQERARRLRHYRPVTLLQRERIVDDSPHKNYHRVTPDNGFGDRVDDFVGKLHPDFSQDTVKRLVESGHIYRYREGRKIYCRLTDRLQSGEFLVVPTKDMFAATVAPPGGDVYETLRTGSGEAAAEFRRAEEQRKEIHLSYKVKQEALDWVLFKNQYVIVVNKPSGISVTKTKDGSLNLYDMLPAWKFTLTNKPLICNYLDADTSGIVVLARTHDTHRMLGKMFQKRAVPNSVYWGFCVGTPKAISGRLKMHLETPKNGVVVARSASTPESRVALAEFVVNASAAEYASFLSFYPLTSRQHQLRIMAAHALRCPIVGDGKFGGESAFPESLDALLGNNSGDDINRKNTKLHLHHRKIQLPYKKRSGEFECVSAPMPEHMQSTFRRLGWATNLDDPLIPG